MNQLFYNIAGGIVHKIRRDFWRSDLLTLSACTIGILNTLTYTEGAFFWDYSGIGILGIDGDRVLFEHIPFSE